MSLSIVILWVKAARPQTLIASVAPVSLAAGHFNDSAEILPYNVLGGCLLFAVLVQIGTNYFNDYLDCLKGADQNRSLGPLRMVAAGKILAKNMRNVAIAILLCAFLVGLVTLLLSSAPLWFLPLGLLCIFLAYGYTGGPYPLAYNGLGDIFVIIFFGIVAFEGTNIMLSSYANTSWNPSLLSAFSVGLLVNNLLVINNYRDYFEDKKNNKKTTAVIFGREYSLFFYIISFGLALIIIPSYFGDYTLTPVSIPSIIAVILMKRSSKKENFDYALTLTAITIFVYTIVSLLK